VDDLLAGSSPDLSSYYTKYEVDNLFAANSYGYITGSARGSQFEFGDQADWVDIPGMSTTFNLSSRKKIKLTAIGSVQMSALRDCSSGGVSFRYIVDGTTYTGVSAGIMGDSTGPEYFVKLYCTVPWAMTQILSLNAGSHSVTVQVKPSSPQESSSSMKLPEGQPSFLYVESINTGTR
jgi:hypothetical protein